MKAAVELLAARADGLRARAECTVQVRAVTSPAQPCTHCEQPHDTLCDRCGRPVCYACVAPGDDTICVDCALTGLNDDGESWPPAQPDADPTEPAPERP